MSNKGAFNLQIEGLQDFIADEDVSALSSLARAAGAELVRK